MGKNKTNAPKSSKKQSQNISEQKNVSRGAADNQVQGPKK